MASEFNMSGRIDSFEFELIDCRSFRVTGILEGVVGGTLSFGYYTDLQVSGQLQVVDVPESFITDDSLIRVYFCPKTSPDKDTQRIMLGTFFFTATLHYENGMYKGTLNLRSQLARFIDDVTSKRWTFQKGESVKDMYFKVFHTLGGFASIEGVKNAKLAKDHVFEAGTAPIKILQYIADFAGAEITTNASGFTVLRKYETPGAKAKNIKHTLKADGNSVILPGVEMSNSFKQIPNKVVCVFNETIGEQTYHYYGTASLDDSDPRSYKNTDRYITKYYALNNLKKPYKENLEKMAANYLKKANHNYTYYEFDCYYQPITLGEVIWFIYDDIKVKGLVTDIDIDLSLGGKMHVKIRKV